MKNTEPKYSVSKVPHPYVDDRLFKTCRCIVSDFFSSVFSMWDSQWIAIRVPDRAKPIIHVKFLLWILDGFVFVLKIDVVLSRNEPVPM